VVVVVGSKPFWMFSAAVVVDGVVTFLRRRRFVFNKILGVGKVFNDGKLVGTTPVVGLGDGGCMGSRNVGDLVLLLVVVGANVGGLGLIVGLLVGVIVGLRVGENVGDDVGILVVRNPVGLSVGEMEGCRVGTCDDTPLGLPEGDPLGVELGDAEGAVDGDLDGFVIGESLGALLFVGPSVGPAEGKKLPDGDSLGEPDGAAEGDELGLPVGLEDGRILGIVDGPSLDTALGTTVGGTDGVTVGICVGNEDGSSVGAEVGSWVGALGKVNSTVIESCSEFPPARPFRTTISVSSKSW